MAQVHCDLGESRTVTVRQWQLPKQYGVTIGTIMLKMILIL